jgi:hypothetical protein
LYCISILFLGAAHLVAVLGQLLQAREQTFPVLAKENCVLVSRAVCQEQQWKQKEQEAARERTGS